MLQRFASTITILALTAICGLSQITVPATPAEVQSALVTKQLRTLTPPTNPASGLQELLNRCMLPTTQDTTFKIFKVNNQKHAIEGYQWGAWNYDHHGRAVWIGALHLNDQTEAHLTHFDQFNLNEGDRLYLYNQNKSHTIGALTALNNSPQQQLSTAPLIGSTLIVQYEPADGVATSNMPWHINRVTTWLPTQQPNLRSDDHPWGKGEPWGTTKTLGCIPNIIANDQYQRQSRSILLMVTDDETISTGALINNSKNDGKPYVLTSAHCVNKMFAIEGKWDEISAQAARSVFFFNFFSPVEKRYLRGIEEQSIAGSQLIAIDETSDMALLELTGGLKDAKQTTCTIPESYMPYFAGWYRGDDIQAPATGIHHPWGAVKRYSQSNATPIRDSYITLFLTVRGDKHWRVKHWDIGATAPGASGSPLFDGSGRIIGALTGGDASCDDPRNDYYWSIAESWYTDADNHSLQPYLASDNRELMGVEGYEPYSVARASYLLGTPQAEQISVVEHALSTIAVPYTSTKAITAEGVVLVVNKMTTFPQATLQLFRGATIEQAQLIHEQAITHPQYNGEMGIPNGRLLKYPMQFFIDLSHADIQIEANETLFVAVKGVDNQTLQLPIVSVPDNDHTVALPVRGVWGKADREYWIDLIVSGEGAGHLNGNQPIEIIEQGTLNINWQQLADTQATAYVYNTWGMLMKQQTLNRNDQRIALAQYGLPAGAYVVLIVADQGNTQTIRLYYRPQHD